MADPNSSKSKSVTLPWPHFRLIKISAWRNCMRPVLLSTTMLFALILVQPALALDDAPGSWAGKKIMFKSESPTLHHTDQQGRPLEAGTLPDAVVTVLKDNAGRLSIRSGGQDCWVEKKEAILLEEAAAFFTDEIRAKPENAWTYAKRGIAWSARGEYDKAIADDTEAIRRDPKEAVFFNNRGITWHKKLELDKAIADYTEAVRLDPKYAGAFNGRGVAWSNKGEYDKAIADCTEAARLDPKDATAFTNRGVAWSNKGDYDKAIADYTEAIRLNPEYALGFNNRAIAWYYKKDYEKAVVDYTAGIRLDPNSVYGVGNRATAYAKLRRYPDSVRDFEVAIRLAPSMDWVHRDYALFRASCPDTSFRDGKKALEMARKAIELSGKDADWEYFAALAAAYAELGQFDKAVVEQTKALADKSLDKEDRQEQGQRLEMYKKGKPYRDEE
jgi:tetratricopeptide (TPR) repeat protein